MKKSVCVFVFVGVLCGCQSGRADCSEGKELEGVSYPQNAMSETLSEYIRDCQEVSKRKPDGECYKDVDWMVGSGETTWQRNAKYEIVYADKKYLSFFAEEFSYKGGVHGGTKVTVGTIDRETGKVLKAADLIPEQRRAEVRAALEDAIAKHVGKKEWLFTEVKITDNCFVAKDGIHFVYNAYKLASYRDGTIEAVVDLKDKKLSARAFKHPRTWEEIEG